jgi:hypothetical protein
MMNQAALHEIDGKAGNRFGARLAMRLRYYRSGRCYFEELGELGSRSRSFMRSRVSYYPDQAFSRVLVVRC